jgi:Sulfatase
MREAQSKPNVLWLFGDQHRAQMLSCNGDPNVHTPNIDHLSNEGVHFENAVCGSPLCGPFRGSLLTSRYPHECTPGNQIQMPPEMPTIAHALFNLAEDIAETNDVQANHPEIVTQLTELALAMGQRLGDQTEGIERRPIGEVEKGMPLTRYNPDHPYIMAEYDLGDAG